MAPRPPLSVFLDGTRVGRLSQSAAGVLGFEYDEAYQELPRPTPLSLSLPVARRRHGSKATGAFFAGLLPDSEPALERLGREFNVSPRNPFALLRHVGRDAAGAVQVLPDGEASSDAARRQGDVSWLGDDQFDELVRSVASHADDWDPGRLGGRWSLAGAQPKVALFRDPSTGRWGVPQDSTPTTHIIKPAVRGLTDHHLNEYLCLTAAAGAGIPAARTELIERGDLQALVSVRYDRTRADGRWVRRHQEDLCQALAVHPSRKYQEDGGPGVADVADLFTRLRADDRTASSRRFVRALALNVLIGGTDAHAKNYSILLVGDRAQLAPLYDVASAAVYDQHRRLASPLKIGEHWRMLDVTAQDWTSVGRRLGLSADSVIAEVEQLRAALPVALHAAAAGVPTDLGPRAERMVERIVEHVERRWRPSLTRDPDLTI